MSAKIISGDTVTIFHNGSVVTAHESDPMYPSVLEALRRDDYSQAMSLLDKPAVISKFVDGTELQIKGYTVYYKNEPLPGGLARRILKMREQGFDIKPMARFAERLFKNPSDRAIKELYGFLDVNELPITTDGCFMAYKRVREDFTDCHSGTFDNSIGNTIMMQRQDVDDDCERTCSHGLHFCSLGYLKHFTGSKLVALKIDPADVVSIPIDYDNTKGRCCKYEVIEELPMALCNADKDYWLESVV